MKPITPDSQDTPDYMNLRRQTVGDRVLLFLVGTAVGSISGAFVGAFLLAPPEGPKTIGMCLFFEIMFSVTLGCALSVIWAVFQPGWLISLLTQTALKVSLLVFVVFVGGAVWLLSQFLT